MEHRDESPSDQAMQAGMEDLIQAMRNEPPLPRPLQGGESCEETLPPSDDGEGPLARAPWHEVVRPTSLARGAQVGRFVVLDQLGAGGMGVVYAAYDPELDRKVALKLVRPGAAGGNARLRLLAEAQALAKLSHPHVVAIHDVGTVDDQVWLAMEFVQGQTLTAWLEQPHGWREVVKVMRSAGKGLEAAHAAGLLHRDFKPDNVMVGDDGRVRVMDFGLARSRPRDTLESEDEVGLPEDARITRAGTLVGTPAYMAPEQLSLHELTTATDQFSFCVTLWQALYGERPFRGRTAMEIAANVLSGRRRPPPRGRRAPAWLRRACERGLALDPQQRWPSMRVLLDTLAKGHARARIRMGLAALGVLGLLGASAEGHRRLDVASRTAACESTGDEIESVWSDERRQTLRDALLGTGVSYAESTADRVTPWFDAQAEQWREARVEACLDFEVREIWDTTTRDRSMWCLEERRSRLQGTIDEIIDADEAAVQNAVPAASALESVSSCRNEAELARKPIPPSDRHEQVRAISADLDRAVSLRWLGRYEEGLALARDALTSTEALGWPPLRARARFEVGSLLKRVGDLEGAQSAIEDAFFEASDGVAPDVAFAAAADLVFVVGVQMAHPEEGLRWGRHAEVALSGIHDGEGLERARLLDSIAIAHQAAGHYAESKPLLEQSIALFGRATSPNNPLTAYSLHNLAIAHQVTGELDRARELYERALVILETAFGPDHPRVIKAMGNLANVVAATGDSERARELHERVLATRRWVLGPEHIEVAASLNDLGVLFEAAGDHDQARAMHEEALGIRERALGSDHVDVGMSLGNLAGVDFAAGDYDSAAHRFQQALSIYEQALGADHLRVAIPLVGLAEVVLAQHRPQDAIPLVERALAVREQQAASPKHVAQARFLLARALWDAPADQGQDRGRATSLARQARDVLEEVGASSLEDVEQWLADHPTDSGDRLGPE